MLARCLKMGLVSWSLLVSLALFSDDHVHKKEVYLNYLDDLEFNIPANLILRQGKKPSYQIVGDDESLIHVKVVLKPGGDLKFEAKEMDIGSSIIKHLTVYMTVKDLQRLKLGKYAKAQVSNLHLKKLNVELEDHSLLKGDLNADDLFMSIKGSSEVVLKGMVNKQDILIVGNADYDALKLKSIKTSLDVTGGGLIKLNVSKELTVQVKGPAKVVYTGNPKVFHHSVSGKGCVRKLSGKDCLTKLKSK